MNKEIEKYINDEVEKFKNELTRKVDSMLEKENKPKTVWDLKDGDKYYTIYPRDIVCYPFDRDNFDIQARENGNMFLTQEEAEFELERRKIEVIMKKYSIPFNDEKNNWIIHYDYLKKSICIGSRFHISYGTPRFKSKEIAQKVIDEVGKDRLLKYWFRVEE